MLASPECPTSTGRPERPFRTWSWSSWPPTAASRSITVSDRRRSSSTCWVGTAKSRFGDEHHRPVNRAKAPMRCPLLLHGERATPAAAGVRRDRRPNAFFGRYRAASVGRRQLEHADPDQPGPCQQRRARRLELELVPLGDRDSERPNADTTGLYLAHPR